MRVEQHCLHCHAMYLYLMDTIEINGEPVQFLACFQCKRGYTKYNRQVEMIV